ncbi:MAG: TAXI family TRAP transporter solute-binding subunit [Actinobacteria bacterium]|nr:TAXI family TRAP transporter solute-binding subunit [Actinomycetota bacterium]
MKKLLLVFLLVSILLLSMNAFVAAEQTDFKGKFITISTDQPGGGWYTFGGVLSILWQKYIPGLNVTVQTSAGGGENLILLEQKRIDIGLSNPDMAYYKYNGTGTFEGKPAYKDMRSLFNIVGGYTYIVVPQNSTIKTPFDFKGKKFGMPPVGSATNIRVQAVFDAYGLKEGDMEYFRGEEEDLVDALKDGIIDAAMFPLYLGSAIMMDLITANKCKLIPVTGTYRDAIIAKYPFYTAKVIPKEAHGTSEDCDTFGSYSFLAVDASMDEDLAYTLTKTYYEHLDEVKAMYPAAKNLSIQGGVNSVISIQLHPGAEKYFKEMGVIK